MQRLDRERVDAGEWLVEEEESGLDREAPCDLQAALLTAREPACALLRDVSQPKLRQELICPLPRRASATSALLENRGDVVADAQLREHRTLLWQVAEAEPRPFMEGELGDVRVVDQHAAARRMQEPNHHRERHGLASAVWSEEADDLSLSYVDVYTVDDPAAGAMPAQRAGCERGLRQARQWTLHERQAARAIASRLSGGARWDDRHTSVGESLKCAVNCTEGVPRKSGKRRQIGGLD